jgi:hypothetical protein
VEGHVFLVRHDLHHFHGGLQALAFLRRARHVGEQLLRVVDFGKLGFALEKYHVLVQHGNIVAAPGEQHVILAAPFREGGHRFVKLRRVGQIVLVDMGDARNAGMQADLMLGLNQLGKRIHHLQLFVHLHRADLDHFKQQLSAHAFVGGGMIGNGLVPFQVQDNVLHTEKPSGH